MIYIVTIGAVISLATTKRKMVEAFANGLDNPEMYVVVRWSYDGDAFSDIGLEEFVTESQTTPV